MARRGRNVNRRRNAVPDDEFEVNRVLDHRENAVNGEVSFFFNMTYFFMFRIIACTVQ